MSKARRESMKTPTSEPCSDESWPFPSVVYAYGPESSRRKPIAFDHEEVDRVLSHFRITAESQKESG